jgi:hypothetical protein
MTLGKAKENMTEQEKADRSSKLAGATQGAVSAGSGLLTGIAQAMLTEPPPPDVGHAGIPGGSPGTIKATNTPLPSYGQARLPDRQSMALEMLRMGGYK